MIMERVNGSIAHTTLLHVSRYRGWSPGRRQGKEENALQGEGNSLRALPHPKGGPHLPAACEAACVAAPAWPVGHRSPRHELEHPMHPAIWLTRRTPGSVLCVHNGSSSPDLSNNNKAHPCCTPKNRPRAAEAQ